MRRILREQDIFWWIDYYLQAALGTLSHDFHAPRECFPLLEIEEYF